MLPLEGYCHQLLLMPLARSQVATSPEAPSFCSIFTVVALPDSAPVQLECQPNPKWLCLAILAS